MFWNVSRSLVSLSAVLGVIGVAVFSQPAGATVIRPTSVTGSLAGDAGSSDQYLISANGGSSDLNLQRPEGTEVPLNTGASLADALATLHVISAAGHSESWTNNSPSLPVEFVFDLGSDTSVGSILLWQYGNSGSADNQTGDFRVILHTEAEGSSFDFSTETADIDDVMQQVAVNTASNVAQFFSFGSSQTARYVALSIDSRQGGGTLRVGLGEVRLATEIAVPEPISSILAVVGLIGLLLVPRRRNRRS